MKYMILRTLTVFSISALLMSCGDNKTSEHDSTSSDSTISADNTSQEAVAAVSIWDKVSVRESASAEGKWLTSISLGETLTYLGEEKTDADKKTYLKVELNDGTQGWSRTEFIIPEAEPAVFVRSATIYNRPDLLTKTDNEFSSMDIAAVKGVDGDFVEVVGKPSGEKWLKSGWVKSSNVTYEQVDIAMAKFAQPVIVLDDSEEKAEQLKEILDNQDLTASVFTANVKEALDAIVLAPVEVTPDSTSAEN